MISKLRVMIVTAGSATMPEAPKRKRVTWCPGKGGLAAIPEFFPPRKLKSILKTREKSADLTVVQEEMPAGGDFTIDQNPAVMELVELQDKHELVLEEQEDNEYVDSNTEMKLERCADTTIDTQEDSLNKLSLDYSKIVETILTSPKSPEVRMKVAEKCKQELEEKICDLEAERNILRAKLDDEKAKAEHTLNTIEKERDDLKAEVRELRKELDGRLESLQKVDKESKEEVLRTGADNEVLSAMEERYRKADEDANRLNEELEDERELTRQLNKQIQRLEISSQQQHKKAYGSGNTSNGSSAGGDILKHFKLCFKLCYTEAQNKRLQTELAQLKKKFARTEELDKENKGLKHDLKGVKQKLKRLKSTTPGSAIKPKVIPTSRTRIPLAEMIQQACAPSSQRSTDLGILSSRKKKPAPKEEVTNCKTQ